MNSGSRFFRLIAGLAVAFVAVAVYLNSLPNQYVLDDIPAVVDNPAAHWPVDLESIFTTNYWGSRANYSNLTIYRPLSTLSFSMVDAVAGDGPAVQRMVNILLHAGCSVLVFLLALLVLSHFRHGRKAALACALLFAVHPVHSEAVIAVVSRAELMAAFFVLLGSWLFLRRAGRPKEIGIIMLFLRRTSRPGWRFLICMSGIFALALLSKENGATLWGVVAGIQLAGLAHYLWQRQSKDGTSRDWRALLAHLWIHVCFGTVLGGYMLLRSKVLSAVLGGELAVGDNPMVGGPAITRILTPFKVFAEYARLLVAPVNLTIDYSLNHLEAVTSVGDPAALAGLALFLTAVVSAVWFARNHPLLSALMLGFFATYIVVSNILFLSTIIMAERLIFLPSAFFLVAFAYCVLSGHGDVSYGHRSRPRSVLLLAATVVVLLLFAGLTVQRNLEWRTPLTLYSAAVEAAPNSAKSHHLLANELYAREELARSLGHYARAVEIDGENFPARTNYARVLAKTGDYGPALRQLKEVLTQAPGYRPAFNLVCVIYERTGQPPGAAGFCFPSNR